MKNLFKKNVKVIAATTLAAVVTISMSFTSQEIVDVKSQETTAIAKNQAKEIKKGFPPTVAVVFGLAALTCKAAFGGYSDNNNEIANNNILNAEIAKVSQFD